MTSDSVPAEHDFQTALRAGLARTGEVILAGAGCAAELSISGVEPGIPESDPDAAQPREPRRSASEDLTVPIFPIWITVLDRPITVAASTSEATVLTAAADPAPQDAQAALGTATGVSERVLIPHETEKTWTTPETATPEWVPVDGYPDSSIAATSTLPPPDSATAQSSQALAAAAGAHNAAAPGHAAVSADAPMPEVMAGLMRPTPAAAPAETATAPQERPGHLSGASMVNVRRSPVSSELPTVATGPEPKAGDDVTQISSDESSSESAPDGRQLAQSVAAARREPESGHAREQSEEGRREHDPGGHRTPGQPPVADVEPHPSMAPQPFSIRAVHHDAAQAAAPPAAPAVAVSSPASGAETLAPPLRTVQVQLGDTPGEGVNLRFVESGGVVTVSVRTQDESLAAALNAGTSALEGRLQAQGWSSEFHPIDKTAAELNVSDGPSSSGSSRQQEAVGAPAVRQAQAGPGTGSGDPNRRPNASWAEQNEELLNTAALRRLGQKGVRS